MSWAIVGHFFAGVGATVGAWLFHRALRLPAKVAKPGSPLAEANDVVAGVAADAAETQIDAAVDHAAKN